MDTKTKTTEERVLSLMNQAAAAAHDALGRYKFERFGYHSSQWVMLNKVLDRPQPNPFRELVQFARTLNAGASRTSPGDPPTTEAGGSVITMLQSKPEGASPTFDEWINALQYDDDNIWAYLERPGSDHHAHTGLGLVAFTFRYTLEEDGEIIAHGTCHPATKTSRGSLFTNWHETLAEARFEIMPRSDAERQRVTAAIAPAAQPTQEEQIA